MKPQRRPHISEEKIIEASWKLLASQGIEQFTMRGLAKELNIQAPTIYWYFESKQILYQALANEVARDIIRELPAEGGWSERLLQSAWTIWRKLQQFPCSAQLLMKTRPEADYLQLFDCLLQMLEPTPLSDAQKFSYISHAFNFVINFAVDEYERSALEASLGGQATEMQADLSAFPIIQRMHEGRLFALIGSDELFESGIQLLLIGIERRVSEASRDSDGVGEK